MILTEAQQKIVDQLKKKYSVKNVKLFRGMEGYGMNSTLYENGKKLCNVDDDGNGGCLNWGSWSIEQRLNEELKKVGKFKYDATDTMTFNFDAETFVNMLVDEYTEEKEYKRKCKTKTLFITTECQKGQYVIMNNAYTPQLKLHLENKYGNKLVEIINERYL